MCLPAQAQTALDWQILHPGLTYAQQTESSNREGVVHRLHWLRIDLEQANLKVVMTPQNCAGLVLPELDGVSGVLASINASFFSPGFDARGHTVSSGAIWQNSYRLTEGPTLACTQDRQCEIVHQVPTETPAAWLQASSGVHSLVVHGKTRSADDDQVCPSFCETTHPRTAVGLDATGRWMFWVTAEGRRKSVEGLPLSKLASFMVAQGISEAINLDGGGSTGMHVMGVARTARPDNEPQPRKIANAWVVMDQSAPASSLDRYCQSRPPSTQP